jgi:hypothetical protein
MSVCLPTKIAEAEATTEHSIQTYTASACAASREGAYLRGAPTPERSARACVCVPRSQPPLRGSSGKRCRRSPAWRHQDQALLESTTIGVDVCVCVSVCVCVCRSADHLFVGAPAGLARVLCRSSSKSSSAPRARRHTSSAEQAAPAASSLEGSARICAQHPDINRRAHTYSTQYIPIV